LQVNASSEVFFFNSSLVQKILVKI